MRFKWLLVVPLLAAMGSGLRTDRVPPPPVALPQGSPAPSAAPAPQPQPALTILAASEVAPEAFRWQARPLVVFADTAANPAFVRQLAALNDAPAPLALRDVVVITDADPAARSAWRERLRPEGFSVVLIDKDGQVKMRKPAPLTVREITRSIDKFPSRLQEIGRAALGL